MGAVGSKRALQITGEQGDGWLSWVNTPETFRAKLEVVKSAASNSGRKGRRMDAVAWLYTTTAENETELRKVIDFVKQVLPVEGTILKSHHLNLPEGLSTTYQNLLVNEEIKKRTLEFRDSIPDGIVFRLLVHGTPAQMIEKISEFKKAGATHLIIHFMEEGEAAIRKFSRRVLTDVKGL